MADALTNDGRILEFKTAKPITLQSPEGQEMVRRGRERESLNTLLEESRMRVVTRSQKRDAAMLMFGFLIGVAAALFLWSIL